MQLGFNDIGRCAVTFLSSTMGGSDAVAASVHAMMVQERQQLLGSLGATAAVAMPLGVQPMQMVQQTTTTTTSYMPVGVMAMPMGEAVPMGQPATVVA